ncbi:orexin receptor type 2 [Lingula anatina]|uniref:Orexin receptor type 2 n=1 Tax=Lingula anatina TaxID=7574 RepID=A0A1S3HTW9_LINAN|nr:orexin receptor type 2 [Lingula anatina]|eukprot:XP_013389468.1 orexin receptor type 2 [Lingula anatina]
MDNFTLSDQDMEQMDNGPTVPELAVTLCMLALFMITGTAGNALVLYVYGRKKENTSTRVFIITLAVIDLLSCAIVVPFTIVVEYTRYRLLVDFLCKFYQFLVTSTIPMSAFVMAAIAIDRYICICHPTRNKITIGQVKIAVAVLGALASIMGIMTALCYKAAAGTVYLQKCNETLCEIETLEYEQLPEIYSPSVNETFLNPSDAAPRGTCISDTALLGEGFKPIYRKVHASLYAVVFLIISVIYFLLFISVQKHNWRRSKLLGSQKARASMMPRATSLNGNEADDRGDQSPHAGANGHTCETRGVHDVPIMHEEPTINLLAPPIPLESPKTDTPSKKRKPRRERINSDVNDVKRLEKKISREMYLKANIKIAMMLFVVTLVFVVTYLPAALMANGAVKYKIYIFYCYFINNMANPVIYSFMNKKFRQDLKQIFARRRNARGNCKNTHLTHC